MGKFKVGDIVGITPPGDWDTGPSFVMEMGRWCYSPVVIESIVHEGEHEGDGGWYTLAGGEFYYFAGDWMKKVMKFRGNK